MISRDKPTSADFETLVREHLDAVYSQARRMVRDPGLAEDVTQAVFILLQKNLSKVLSRPVPGAWLHRVTRNVCHNALRSRARRDRHEQAAARVQREAQVNERDETWDEIEPKLDELIHQLSDSDRAAIVLRYLDQKSIAQMASVLSVSEDAAKQRVSRAVHRLRQLFQRRGIALQAAALPVMLERHCVTPAPTGLIGSTPAAGGVALAKQTSLTMFLSKAATAVAAGVLLCGASIGVVLLQQAAPDRAQASPQLAALSIVMPATAPATMPAEPTTPLGALNRWVQAVNAGSVPPMEDLLAPTDPMVMKLYYAFVTVEAATKRMTLAWEKQFHVPFQVPGYDLQLLPKLDGGFAALVEYALAAPERFDLIENGDDAELQLNLPAEAVGNSRQGTVWMAQARIKLKRIDGLWKLDLPATILIKTDWRSSKMAQNDDAERLEFVLDVQRRVVATQIKLAKELEAGQYKSVEEASAALKSRLDADAKEVGLDYCNTTVAPRQ